MIAALLAGLAAWLALPPGLARLAPSRRAPVPGWLRARPGAPGRLVRGLAAGLFAVLVVAVAGFGPVPLLVAGVGGAGAFVGLGAVPVSGSRRHRLAIARDLPQALDLMAACLAAGLSLRHATQAVGDAMRGPVAAELGRVRERLLLGASDAEAWLCVAGEDGLGGVARDLARGAGSGVGLVDVLGHHAEEARRTRRGLAEASARAVGVRSVLPLMVCFLPAFLLVGVVPIVAGVVLRLLG